MDIERIRSQFPALSFGAAHFDGPGGTQTPTPVSRAMFDLLEGPVANRGTVTLAEQRAEETVTGARSAMADLLGASAPNTVMHLMADSRPFEGVGQSDLVRGACWFGPLGTIAAARPA